MTAGPRGGKAQLSCPGSRRVRRELPSAELGPTLHTQWASRPGLACFSRTLASFSREPFLYESLTLESSAPGLFLGNSA